MFDFIHVCHYRLPKDKSLTFITILQHLFTVFFFSWILTQIKYQAKTEETNYLLSRYTHSLRHTQTLTPWCCAIAFLENCLQSINCWPFCHDVSEIESLVKRPIRLLADVWHIHLKTCSHSAITSASYKRLLFYNEVLSGAHCTGEAAELQAGCKMITDAWAPRSSVLFWDVS